MVADVEITFLRADLREIGRGKFEDKVTNVWSKYT